MSVLNINSLANCILNCVFQSCQIIDKTPNLLLKFKQEDDPVTEIDHTVQKHISDSLSLAFPGIKIVGEEKIDQSIVCYQSILEKTIINFTIPDEFLKHSQQFFKSDEITIFIDPLDGTRSFVSGSKWECTVLVGVVHKGKTIMGAIGQPFKQALIGFQYQPKVIIGGEIFRDKLSLQCSLGLPISPIWSIFYPQINQDRKKVATSSRRSSSPQKNMINKLMLSKLPCGGSGNKLKKLITGEVDLVMFLQTPTSTWDSCAGQAIIKAMGGVFFKPDLTCIKYSPDNINQLNSEGFIASFDSKLISQMTEILLQYV